jgi:hypothetical protein
MRDLLARLRAPAAGPSKAWADVIADRVARGEYVSLAAREAAAAVRARRHGQGAVE